jgi:hypothetical protein
VLPNIPFGTLNLRVVILALQNLSTANFYFFHSNIKRGNNFTTTVNCQLATASKIAVRKILKIDLAMVVTVAK